MLAGELRAVGAHDVREARAGVAFTGGIDVAYAACLWSRTASRVLMRVARVPASDADELYEGVRALPWQDHVSADGTLAVDFSSDPNPAFRNTMFGALKVKDAIVDRLRDLSGRRPSVDTTCPDVRVNVRVRKQVATVSIDLSGEALHRRGYREPGVQGAAPLKESLAAGVLLLAGWSEIAARGGALVDPLCGSGTLLIEGAWIAGDVAPGLLRAHWGFSGWLGHDAGVWSDLLSDADARAEAGVSSLPPIAGSDVDAGAVSLALANVGRAGLRGRVSVARAAVRDAAPSAGAPAGLVAANPPYGERLGGSGTLRTYRDLGETLSRAFGGWEYAVLSPDDEHAAALGLVPASTFSLHNGAIPVRLDAGHVPSPGVDPTAGSEAFANRLRKNRRRIGTWARRKGVTCWRAYDADLPDFAVAVDVYDCVDGVRRVVVYEYEAPPEIDEVKTRVRLEQATAIVASVLDADPSEVRVKVRRRQRGEAQYERLGSHGRMHEVREAGTRLLVDLDDYLDTGLFLDHRITRALVADLAREGSLLNLFCYTGAATARSVTAGARSSVSVDLSNTYLAWAKKNAELNGADTDAHRFVRADVLGWLDGASRSSERFDVVFCDPPSFSSSAAMRVTFDVQRDHAGLLAAASRLLTANGTLVFSTNLRTFRIDGTALAEAGLEVEDISGATIPLDFARSPRVHRCYLVRHQGGDAG